ncbi:hypothetical protein Lser_V15G19016 [Lactuca serriola]
MVSSFEGETLFQVHLSKGTICNIVFLFSNGALNSSSMEPLDCNGYPPVLVQSSYDNAPTIVDMQNVWDQSAQGDAVAPVEVELSSESVDRFIEQSMGVLHDDAATENCRFRHSCKATISSPFEVEWSSESMDRFIKQYCMGVSQDDDAEDPKTQLNLQTGSNHYMVDICHNDTADQPIRQPLDDAYKWILNTVSFDF